MCLVNYMRASRTLGQPRPLVHGALPKPNFLPSIIRSELQHLQEERKQKDKMIKNWAIRESKARAEVRSLEQRCKDLSRENQELKCQKNDERKDYAALLKLATLEFRKMANELEYYKNLCAKFEKLVQRLGSAVGNVGVE
ncbi:hypothetical protein TWF506_009421 [Arthrobotrys conoides]|uniref:Uncharacterized protein n=1 Tax=Arthrobotrys conoides TaxID=74498 RepID=A0AAN8NCG2_9PEZI